MAISLGLGEMEDNKSTDHIFPHPSSGNEGESVDVLRYERGSAGKASGGGGKARKLAVWVHTERQTWSDGASGRRQSGAGA